MKKMLPIIGISLILDQIIKVIIINYLSLYQSINVIKSFFNITYVRNNGAAWSILSGNRLLLISISIVALIIIYNCFIRNQKLTKLENFSYGILIGGTVGNLTDRIFRGYVVDYLDFNLFGYNFPIFNFADICIVIGISLICIVLIGGELRVRNKNN
ncbi:MAG: signal peptidase II [Firmicutes bacterium]|nr:signal peptidase II [Bacillota bacterium]